MRKWHINLGANGGMRESSSYVYGTEMLIMTSITAQARLSSDFHDAYLRE